jgi:predicted TIM-barrel fold metal-dependent hydrolase
MFKTTSGEEIFIIDGHVHNWDASKANQKNLHGEQFINCFYAYHTFLTPKEKLWTREKFERYGNEQLYRDLFVEGYDDMAVFQPTYLRDFYVNGFFDDRQTADLTAKHPNRFIVNGAFDPRDEAAGLDRLEEQAATLKLKGVKLYTADWKGASRGYKLTDPWAEKYLAHCEKLGIRNIHVHKGPTILPLDRDAFDVADIDHAATNFQGLNFIVEHCGLPRLDDFCWIATQETNVYGGLAVALPFIRKQPKYFAHVISQLLMWLGPDKLLFGSDYGIWTPDWLIEDLMAFELPEDIAKETGVTLDLEAKKKILGLNAARLYDIDIAAQKLLLAGERAVVATHKRELASERAAVSA